MLKDQANELFKDAVRKDKENHINAGKGNVDRWVPSATLNLLITHPDEISDQWIEASIENRENERKRSRVLDNDLELELVALGRLKRTILQSFPNSFSINRKL